MGLGVVAIADPPTAIRLKVPFSDGLGGGEGTCRLLNEYRVFSGWPIIISSVG